MTLRSRLRRVSHEYLVTKVFVKLKFADFQGTTVECAAREPEPARVAELLGTALGRSPLPVRLLGIGVRFVDLREESNPDAARAVRKGCRTDLNQAAQRHLAYHARGFRTARPGSTVAIPEAS